MEKNKPTLFNGVKYLALALPLLFLGPIVITMGFKALKKDGAYLLLILGIIMALAAMVTTAMGVLKVAKHFFEKDRDED